MTIILCVLPVFLDDFLSDGLSGSCYSLTRCFHQIYIFYTNRVVDIGSSIWSVGAGNNPVGYPILPEDIRFSHRHQGILKQNEPVPDNSGQRRYIAHGGHPAVLALESVRSVGCAAAVG